MGRGGPVPGAAVSTLLDVVQGGPGRGTVVRLERRSESKAEVQVGPAKKRGSGSRRRIPEGKRRRPDNRGRLAERVSGTTDHKQQSRSFGGQMSQEETSTIRSMEMSAAAVRNAGGFRRTSLISKRYLVEQRRGCPRANREQAGCGGQDVKDGTCPGFWGRQSRNVNSGGGSFGGAGLWIKPGGAGPHVSEYLWLAANQGCSAYFSTRIAPRSITRYDFPSTVEWHQITNSQLVVLVSTSNSTNSKFRSGS